MKLNKLNIGNVFLLSALIMLILGLVFGVLASVIYIFPGFLKQIIGFASIRPLHVSFVMFWIILGATGCVYSGLENKIYKLNIIKIGIVQWILWLLAIVGIVISYFKKDFGGREYWEFNPAWALPIAFAWILFLVNFISSAKNIKNWPVYIWMWMTGILFFLFSFTENYLWIFPYFREHFLTDMTIQWKVNGSLVGAWNQILYGTAIYLMDKISGSSCSNKNNLAFLLYFLGLFNLMFNWGHHIYTLPTDTYIKYIGYAVSMTEWIFFLKIIYQWKSTLNTFQKNYHYFPYRFLMAADIWIFINMGQAILMSVPAINIYSHGTHITVAHAMGTTIGINSMILFAACFEFLIPKNNIKKSKYLNYTFWVLQFSLFVFLLSLNIAGLKKSFWQLSLNQSSYTSMMETLKPYFIIFVSAGFVMLFSLSIIAVHLIKNSSIKNTLNSK